MQTKRQDRETSFTRAENFIVTTWNDRKIRKGKNIVYSFKNANDVHVEL